MLKVLEFKESRFVLAGGVKIFAVSKTAQTERNDFVN